MARHWVADSRGCGPEARALGLVCLAVASEAGAGQGAALGDRPASWVAANANAIAFHEHAGFALDGAREVVTDWGNLVELRMIR